MAIGKPHWLLFGVRAARTPAVRQGMFVLQTYHVEAILLPSFLGTKFSHSSLAFVRNLLSPDYTKKRMWEGFFF